MFWVYGLGIQGFRESGIQGLGFRGFSEEVGLSDILVGTPGGRREMWGLGCLELEIPYLCFDRNGGGLPLQLQDYHPLNSSCMFL